LNYGGNDPAMVQKRQELQQAQDAAIKQALTPERYQLYQLLHDPAFRDAQTTLERSGAPLDKALPVYQVNQLSLTAERRIQNDPTLTAQERQKALELVRQEQRKSIQQILRNQPQPTATEAPASEDNPTVYPPMPTDNSQQ
jgi:hypothetical protein